jgi:predicted transcriptional regulator
MDSFDKRILSVLRDGRPRDFRQLLRDADFSHNTLRTHLASLERQGFIIKEKKPIKRQGRPVFVYRARHKIALTIKEPQTTIVSLTFQGLKHLCKFEKGEYCKKVKRKCEAQNCPQILKEE